MIYSDEEMSKLVQLIFSGKYTFKFVVGDSEDTKFLNTLEKLKKTWKTFDIEENMDSIAAIFYK